MKKIFFLGIIFAVATLLPAQSIPLGPPDAIYINGKVITVDQSFSINQAFAVRGEYFVGTGTNAEVKALASKSTRIVDLQGRVVMPGLMDNHNHMYRAASTLLRGYDMMGAASLKDLLDRLQKAVASGPKGKVQLAGGGWDARTFPEKRAPTKQELDTVSPQDPLVLIRSRNEIYLNSAALKAAGITKDTKPIGGIEIPKDSQGEPMGRINEQAPVNFVMKKFVDLPTEAEKRDIMLKAQRIENANGLTTIRELQLAPDIMRMYSDLHREGKLTLRVSMGIEAASDEPERLEAMLSPWGVGPGFGDNWLRLDCVGEFSVTTAPGSITPQQLNQAMIVINKYGWRPCIHVNEEKALDKVLDAYEAADKVKSIRPMRWVLEHAVAMQPRQMDRATRLGLQISAQIQTYFDGLLKKDEIEDWTAEKAQHRVPLRSWLNHKLPVSSGTDWPGRLLSPFLTIQHFVTRKDVDGQVVGIEEKITREEAIRLATVNNAYLVFEENLKGSIEPGRLADFLILSGDILTIPEDQIEKIRPIATVVGGRRVFATTEGNAF